MSPTYRSVFEPEDQAANRQSASLAALAVTLLVVVIGFYLIERLRAEARFEDCVLSGRSACSLALAE